MENVVYCSENIIQPVYVVGDSDFSRGIEQSHVEKKRWHTQQALTAKTVASEQSAADAAAVHIRADDQPVSLDRHVPDADRSTPAADSAQAAVADAAMTADACSTPTNIGLPTNRLNCQTFAFTRTQPHNLHGIDSTA